MNIESNHLNSSSSKQWKASEIPSMPFMEEEGIAVLKEELGKARVFLEYGSGGSTVMASGYRGVEIHSIDSDAGFLSAVKERCFQDHPGCDLHIHHVEVGPSSEWGVPSDPTNANLWPAYCIKPWIKLHKKGTKPDLILVDGRFRVSSFLASLALAPLGTVIMFDDYTNRKQYHTIEKHVFPETLHGRMARFQKVKEPNLGMLLPDILMSCTNPD